MRAKSANLIRCAWPSNPLSIRYHDEEWGLPQHDDRVLFEFLILEGAQAGLSWDTVLQKRENYRLAFDGFNPQRVARYDRRKQQSLLRNPGIIRNRLKVYEGQTAPLIDHYTKRGLLVTVPATGEVDAVYSRLKSALALK